MLDSMIVISFYIAFGLLLIFNTLILIFNKSLKNKKILRIDKYLKYFLVVIILLSFALLPLSFILENYHTLDLSKPLDVYKFWDEAFSNMENNARIYVLARAANVGMFVNTYEYGEKGIKYIYHTSPQYSPEDMIKALEDGIPVYFVGNSNALLSIFNAEQIGRTYYWDRYRETLRLFKVIEPAVNIEISYLIDNCTKEFGKEFTVKYVIKNKNKKSIKINSLELELPDNIEFIETDPSGYINQGPGLSGGIYMWVSDSYIIEGNGQVSLIVKLRGIRPGKSLIKFRLTTNGIYINGDDIAIEITK